MWGELNDFADVWIQPAPGRRSGGCRCARSPLGKGENVSADARSAKRRRILRQAKDDAEQQPLSVVYALPHFGAAQAGATIAALANIAIDCAGDDAAKALFVLPQEANVWGMRDTGGSPELLPGYREAADEASRKEMERHWGAPIPSAAGLTFEQMTADGKLKALLVLNDNPLMLAPGSARVKAALESLDFLGVIDSMSTDTAKLAHAVLPDVGAWAKEGTTISADRRVLRLDPAVVPQGEGRQGWRILADLGNRLTERLQSGEVRIHYKSAAHIMDEMAQVIPLYQNAIYSEMDSGEQQRIDGLGPTKAARQQLAPVAASRNGGFTLRQAGACTRATKGRQSTPRTPISCTAKKRSASTPQMRRRWAWRRVTPSSCGTAAASLR